MSCLRFTWIYAGDGIHVSAGLILVGWILQNETCKGISGRTQVVTTIVNCLKLAYVAVDGCYPKESSLEYELVINVIVTAVSLALMYIMYVKYKKTVEKDYDTFWIEVLIILSVCLALAYNGNRDDPLNVMFCTGRYLESGAILPQMYFLFRTGSKKLCVSLYVFLSFLYILFYACYFAGTDVKHWTEEDAGPPYSLWPSFIQMIFYILYFLQLVIVPKYKMEVPLTDVESYTESTNTDTFDYDDKPHQSIPTIIVTRPQLVKQQSLLETPFLKKSLPSANSLASFNFDGTARVKKTPSPFPRRKPNRADNSKGLREVLTLPNLSRTRSCEEIPKKANFFPIETSSEETSPEDEGITFTTRETANHSRQRRIAYVRQTSLPETGTLSEASPKKRHNSKPEYSYEILENNNNLFLPGDEVIKFRMMKPSFDQAELKTPAKPEVPPPPLELMPEEIEVGIINTTKEKTQSNPEIVGIIETKTYEQKRFFKSKNGEVEDKHDLSKNSSQGRAKQKRASVHHAAMSNRNNWKTIACNFIGTSPVYDRRPSFLGIVEVDSGDEFPSGDSTSKNQKFIRWRADDKRKPGDQNGKVSSARTLERRRATVHHVSPLQHSWKTMASAWLGTSHNEEIHPSASIGIERSLSDMNPSLTHKARRKTFWHI